MWQPLSVVDWRHPPVVPDLPQTYDDGALFLSIVGCSVAAADKQQQHSGTDTPRGILLPIHFCWFYSWIAHQLQVGTSLGQHHNFWFDFKSETSFAFLGPNYMGQCTAGLPIS